MVRYRKPILIIVTLDSTLTMLIDILIVKLCRNSPLNFIICDRGVFEVMRKKNRMPTTKASKTNAMK